MKWGCLPTLSRQPPETSIDSSRSISRTACTTINRRIHGQSCVLAMRALTETCESAVDYFYRSLMASLCLEPDFKVPMDEMSFSVMEYNWPSNGSQDVRSALRCVIRRLLRRRRAYGALESFVIREIELVEQERTAHESRRSVEVAVLKRLLRKLSPPARVNGSFGYRRMTSANLCSVTQMTSRSTGQ